VNFQSYQAKQKQKKFPQNLIKFWDVTYMVSVNMVAERFKVIDSLCGPMNDQMIEHASQLVEAIKTAYHVNY
jgi:hypothetical protein